MLSYHQKLNTNLMENDGGCTQLSVIQKKTPGCLGRVLSFAGFELLLHTKKPHICT